MTAASATPRDPRRIAAYVVMLLAIAGAVAWWVWRATSPLDDAAVRAYYAASRDAILARDVDRYCALIDPAFDGRVTAIGATERVTVDVDRSQACKQMGDLLDVATLTARQTGTSAPLRVEHRIDRIAIRGDRHTADVTTHYRLELVGRLVITGDAQDVIARGPDGVVRIVRNRTSSRTVML